MLDKIKQFFKTGKQELEVNRYLIVPKRGENKELKRNIMNYKGRVKFFIENMQLLLKIKGNKT